MGITTDAFVSAYIAEVQGRDIDLDRLVTTPSGLTVEGMIAAMFHPAIGRLAIPLMADFMAPEGSVYYDAIFGAYRGQSAIRQWLVPAMADIEFIDFVPMAEPVVIDDGRGGTWLDEWQMVMNLDGQKIPLSRGVSVRRWRDGWLVWACDVYDTAAFRQPPPPEMAAMADPAQPPLPPCPRVEWPTDRAIAPPVLGDPRVMGGQFHPEDSVFIDPIAGELRGAAAIGDWLADASARVGDDVFEPLGPLLTNGHTSVQEWQRVTAGNADPAATLRGTSVRRVVDGLIVHAADYYDTAAMHFADS